MKYQVGRPGRIAVARFEDGDNVLDGLVQIARENQFKAACFSLVGGMKSGRFVVGPESETLPPKPMWRTLAESHETVGFGTIFWEGDTPKVHFHGSYGKGDSVKMGCMRESAETFLVLEAVVMEIDGIQATRELDPASQMVLLKI